MTQVVGCSAISSVPKSSRETSFLFFPPDPLYLTGIFPILCGSSVPLLGGTASPDVDPRPPQLPWHVSMAVSGFGDFSNLLVLFDKRRH
jgi:hypothetical protein